MQSFTMPKEVCLACCSVCDKTFGVEKFSNLYSSKWLR